jgi:hypothetical protein
MATGFQLPVAGAAFANPEPSRQKYDQHHGDDGETKKFHPSCGGRAVWLVSSIAKLNVYHLETKISGEKNIAR